MKYFLRIVLVFVIAVVAILAVYSYYNNGIRLPESTPTIETTVTKPAATERNAEKQLISSISNKDIFLYKSGKTVILMYESKQFEFDNWSSTIDLEAPIIYYDNFDADDDNEIIIKAVDSKLGENEFVYGLYFLDPYKNDKGELDFSVTYMDRNTWTNITDTILKEEISQLKFSKKLVQFAIDYADVSISYNKDTGIADSGYVGFFSAITDKNGKYQKIEKWSKGTGTYSITDDNKIMVDIPINIKYKNIDEVQYAGDIHFQLVKGKNGGMVVGPKSLVFSTNPVYKVSDPNKYSKYKWTYIEKNSDIIIDENDTKIDWIKYDTGYDATINTQTLSYANTITDINKISKVVITESYIELTGKKDCRFDDSYKKGNLSVIINEGTKGQYNIAYTTELSKDSNNFDVLKINFDRPYSQREIKTIQINYGAK